MRVAATLVALALLSVTRISGDGEPCFVGVPATIFAVDLTVDRAIRLRWSEVPSVEWYEVMRCDASKGPCSLLSLATAETLAYDDSESDSSSHFWYRIIARTGSPTDLCANNETCSLPDGQCAGEGICGPYCEFCWPEWEEPVCGCNDHWYLNPCYACAAGANIRWWGSCAP